ncbi:MAG: hypothetical protein D6795_03485 [Deltaproteobacteria bacterium]|nr:MAG: hypothetical protein D6795_03485 [Deltaproteobacteria bacterium]
MKIRALLTIVMLAFFLSVIVGPGCEPLPAITIVSPEEGETVSYCGSHFEATFQNVTEDPPQAVVTIDDVEITGDGEVEIGGERVEISGFTLSFAGVFFDACGLLKGDRTFAVSITPVTSQVGFRVVIERSCKELLALHPEAEDGIYPVELTEGGGLVEVFCDMTSDGGGWTLVANEVNDGVRHWNTLEAFTGASPFGSLEDFPAADYKSPAHKLLGGSDLMIRTEEYAVAFDDLLGGLSLGDYIAENWPDACATEWIRSGADYFENLTEAQAEIFGFTLRGHDTNCDCFPGCNENVAVTFLASYYWNNGLGNAPNGQDRWRTHDHSFLKASRIVPVSCSGGWPCNENGVYLNNANECYDASCKTQRAEVYVR